MKLVLFVPLIWTLFSAAEALKCLHDVSFLDQWPCKDDQQCLAYALREFRYNRISENITKRNCITSSMCNQTLSLGIDDTRTTASLQCCLTDDCNSKAIPYVEKQKPNGLQCFSTYSLGVSDPVKLQCVGMEDRCVSLNYTSSGKTYQLAGCVSANLCEGDIELKWGSLLTRTFSSDLSRFTVPECCGTSLCNSAPAAKLSVISLLFGLVAFFVH